MENKQDTEKNLKSNRIEEYFSKTEINAGNELFRIDDKNSDLKSELSEEELRYITILKMDDDYLIKKGLYPIFGSYYFRFLRLKVSQSRKGRTEYVDIHKKDNTDSTLQKLSNFKIGMGAKP